MPTPTNGLNPEAERSTVLFAHRLRSADNTGMALLLALMLHGTTSTAWPDEQLWPIRAVEYLPWAPSGAPCGVRLELADGRALLVDFGPDNAP